MKILALDLGDKWVGSAISDGLGISCRPYGTVDIINTYSFLEKVLKEEDISKIVIGYPKTISGTESEQTLKVLKTKEELETKFKDLGLKWILWDERLSSKRAASAQKKTSHRDKQAKIDSHSIAAAFILQSYLDSLALYNE